MPTEPVSAAEGVGALVEASHCGMPFSMKEDCKKIITDNTLGPTHDATRHATLKGKVKERWISMKKHYLDSSRFFLSNINIYICII